MAMNISRIIPVFSRICFKNSTANVYCLRCDFHTTGHVEGKKKFINLGIDLEKYTLRPIRCPKTGGRGYNGKIQVHGIGGGARHHYRMIDFKRIKPSDGPTLVEKVIYTRYDPNRTANIAVVAGGEKKRYIIASENMKEGDIITSTSIIPKNAVLTFEGNAHPLGALPIGTMVHALEDYVGIGARLIRAAGATGQLVRKVGDKCVVKLPSGNEISLPEQCIATVGKASCNGPFPKKYGSAGRARWHGIRPSSGLFHKKTGKHGRKIKPKYTAEKPTKPKVEKYHRHFTFE